MKKNLSLLVSIIIVIVAVSRALATSDGNNNGGALAMESQTSSPIGQTDFQTDPFTGRFSYAVPLQVAPARHNSQPNLELIYNTANANDWCGVGWNLDVGYIERETKYGVPVAWSGGQAQGKYDDTKGFLFSFKNKMCDLVEVSSGVYRAQIQSDFLLFQLSGDTWTVTDKSGTKYYFGSNSASQMNNPKWSQSGDQATFHWALDTIITPTGDKATISYQSIGGRLYPYQYKYNGTANGNISPPCLIQFNLTTTNRPDTTLWCRAAYVVTNQYLLSSIFHTVGGQMVWSNVLNYTFSSSTGRALLTSLTHYGADQSSSLPPITFGYSQQSFTFQSNMWTNCWTPSGGSGDNAYYWAFDNQLCDLVDVDGDGYPDRVIAPYTGESTNWWIQHNNGTNGFGPPVVWQIGVQNLSGNSTSNDVTWAEFNSHGRVVDVNGDGLPDLIVDPISMYISGGSYPSNSVQLNLGTNLGPQFAWTNVNGQTTTAGQSTSWWAVENLAATGGYVQMLDMNGDGLPDRVMVQNALQPYNYQYYWVQFNTGRGFGPTNAFGPYNSQGYSTDLNFAGLTGTSGSTGSGISMRMLDINGDGLPDRVMLVRNSNGPLSPSGQTYLVVELNNGYGFEPDRNWTNLNTCAGNSCGGGTTTGICDLGDDAYVAYRDINGDGLPDRIIACQCSATPYTNFWVQLNTGTGFAPIRNWGPTSSQGQTANATLCGVQVTSSGTGVTMLLDMNGDGLPDRVEVNSAGSGNSNYVVELSSGPFPDLLTVASNGLGGFVSAQYQPATKYDNRLSTNASLPQYLLPFPLYTVSSISVGDGINPSNTTTYAYTGGYWNFNLRQFDGFAQTTVADPLGTKTIHWFHQAGGRNNSSYGEYLDSTNAIGKVGMEYRTDTYGTDGNPYKTVLNQVNEYSNNLQHFAYVATNIEIDYPATSSANKAKAKVYYYNLSNGNLTNETDWGQVTISTPPSSEVFSDVSGDTVYHLIQYASLSDTNILDAPSSETLSLDNAGNNILRQTLYTYDGNTGNLLQQRDIICNYGTPEYRTNTYTYDSTYYDRITATDPAGIETQITYDSSYETFPITTTIGGSFTTSTTYDPRSGKLYSSTDPAGLVTSNQYDALLRLSETLCSTTPNGTPSEWLDKYTYTLGDSSGPENSVLHQQSDGVDTSNGHQVMTWCDGLGRTIQTRTESETSGEYRVVDTAYDQRGNVEFVSLPYLLSGTSRTSAASGLGALHGYDPIGRPNQLTGSVYATFNGSGVLTGTSWYGGDSGSPVGASTITYYYSTDPWTWVVTDETTNTHRYTMDAYGRTNQVVEVTSGGNYTMNFGWNLASDLLSVTDNVGSVIQYSNNLAGELIAMADPDLGVWQWIRDFDGRVVTQIDGDNQTINYNYSDPLGRLINRQVYDLKGQFAYGITNIYDANTGDTTFPVYKGQLYETIDSEGFRENGYDVRGRKTITRRYVAKNGNTYTNQYSYDDMDRIRSIIYPNGGPTITNIYDYGANLSEVQQVGGTVFYQATSFTPLDQISGISYGNGITASLSYYSNSKRLQTVQTSGGLQDLSYTYDAVADILSISDNDGNYSGTSSASINSVTYDSLHRLVSLIRNGQTYYYGCDSVGNLRTNTESGSGGYVYATTAPGTTHLPHAVKNANGIVCAYDTCGNMLVRGGASLVYNPENRLIGVAVSNQATTFGYEADGTRLWKQGAPTNTLQVWIDNNYEEKDGRVLYHVWAGNRMVCTLSNTVFEYYHPDHLHSTEILSTSSGSLYQHYEYTAYGFGRYTYSTAAFPTTRRYTSQSFDEETGLYCFGARYYDPVIGRFIQADQTVPNIFDPQAYDRYAYARDNPLVFVDPDGHAPLYYYIPHFGPGIVRMQGSEQMESLAESMGYANAQEMNQTLNLGAPTAGDVSGVQGVAGVAAAATTVYINAAQTIATDGIAPAAASAVETAEGGAAEEAGTAAQNAAGSTEAASGSSAASEAETSAGGSAAGSGGASGGADVGAGNANGTAGNSPGATVDPRTGQQVQRFVVDSKGNTMIEPAGGTTKPWGRGGADTHTTYPNGSPYQRLDRSHGPPHAHGHLPGTGPGKAGTGPSLDPKGNIVPNTSSDAHWPVNH